MRYIAHRGMVEKGVTENTIDAFKRAINSEKYSGFELDIRTSKDNKFIVYHDFFIEGKLVSSLTVKDLKKYGVATLDEVLKLKTNKIIMIEVKERNVDVKKLVNILNKSDLNIYLMSFHNNVIDAINKEFHKFKIGGLNYVFNSETNYIGYDFICLLHQIATDSIVKKFRERDIEVFLYGITKTKKAISLDKELYAIVDESGSYF